MLPLSENGFKFRKNVYISFLALNKMKDEIFIHKAKHLDDLSASTTKYSNKKTQLTAKLQELCQIVKKLYEQFNDVKLKFIDARENGLKPLDELTEEYFQYQKKLHKAVIQRELCAQELRTIIKESVENYIDVSFKCIFVVIIWDRIVGLD